MALVQLCRMQLERLGPEASTLRSRIEAEGGEIEVAMCLNACFMCTQRPIARIDGTPVAAASNDELVDYVKALAS